MYKDRQKKFILYHLNKFSGLVPEYFIFFKFHLLVFHFI